ncbi:EAL domain-containing protein [Mangrovicella endophytica]|uniref:EAL domain-containing protein n=1 Tax=Mangrovicella endophytica TaxID=2066697 RepID=UPI000C9EBAF4|nr:EAL domain-containing protein [Mangrovicella endophytica]
MLATPLASLFTRRKARTSSSRLLFLIALSGLGTLGLVVLSALWAGAESDAAALERQRQLMNARLREQVEQAAQAVSQIGIGYMALAQAHLDGGTTSRQAAAADPVGAVAATAMTRIATSVFGYDQAFIINGAGQLAMQADAGMAKRYRWIRPLLQPLLQKLQYEQLRASTADKSRPAAAAATSGLGDPALGSVAELMRLEGRPTIVGLVAVGASERQEPGSAEASAPADTRYLVGIHFLDGDALDDLSREQGLNGARYARAADPGKDEVAFQIDATATGEPIGFIIWSPDLPGSRVVGRLMPALSLAALVIAVLFSALLVRLRRSLIELKSSEHQARHLAFHDVLTKLPNRALFAERLEASVATAAGGAHRMAVALIDLDRFKAVNDTFGHAAGDELIRLATGRMSTLLRPSDTLARLGGDEFALLLPGLDEAGATIATVCSQLVDLLGQPFTLGEGGAIVHVGVSIGVAIAPDAGQSADEVMRYADIALYEAKATGRGRWILFTPSMDKGRSAREILKNELRTVIAAAADEANGGPVAGTAADIGSLEVHFQTIHRATDGYRVSGAEALVRWRHHEHGLLFPNSFIPLAEESGLIGELGQWVLREACRVACSWEPDTFVAVNVSACQLRKPGFADDVLATLREIGFAPSRLELELTESALIDDNQDTATTLARLRAEGIQISLDDFGTGFSSLSHLIRIGIDRIKIDRSFVALLGTKANGAAIVAALISLGRNLGIATTAEGVETETQRDFLVALGCSELQGYLFSNPAPAPELARFAPLRQHGVASRRRAAAGPLHRL